MKIHITDCSEGSSTGSPPKSLKNLGVGRILNRKIVSWSGVPRQDHVDQLA